MNWRLRLLLACVRAATSAAPLWFVLWIGSAWFKFIIWIGFDVRLGLDAGRLEVLYELGSPATGAWLTFSPVTSFQWWFDAEGHGPNRWFWIPLWLPLFLTIVAALFLRHWYRQAFDAAYFGRCRSCGYSRAAVDHDRPCPECGKPLTLPD